MTEITLYTLVGLRNRTKQVPVGLKKKKKKKGVSVKKLWFQVNPVFLKENTAF